jgi:hypothetical protein
MEKLKAIIFSFIAACSFFAVDQVIAANEDLNLYSDEGLMHEAANVELALEEVETKLQGATSSLPQPLVSPSPTGEGYAMGQYIAEPTLWSRFTSEAPSWLISLVPLFILLSLACRAIAEVLFFIKDKTPTDVDNRAYALLLKVLDILANLMGAVGLGMPKPMIVAKADKIAVKEETANG